MILIVSRFMVHKGFEPQVRQAPHKPPRLGDCAPGLLSIEVITNGGNDSVIYLITR
jgi:hypothetical protein